MKKSPFIIVLSLITAVCIGSFWKFNKHWSFGDKLGDAVGMAEIQEYQDSAYGFTARFPEFFKQESVGEGYACFGFHNGTNIEIEYFAMPNTNLYSLDEGRKVIEKENHAMKSRKNEDGFTISGHCYMNGVVVDGYAFYSKYVYMKRMWYVCRLIYPVEYRQRLKRLFMMVDDWRVWK